MRTVRSLLMIAAMILTQQVFADAMMPDDVACGVIAKACLDAGYVKTESATKGIWHDCMKPIILGKKVSSVTVDKNVVKTCRMNKIKSMKAELVELQSVK